MMRKKSLPVRLGLAVAVLLSTGALLANSSGAQSPPIILHDFCTSQAPDATAWLPRNGSSFAVSSGDAGYASKLCPRYLVDVAIMATGWPSVRVRPDMALDEFWCEALTMKLRVYTRLTGTGFTRAKNGSYKGSWNYNDTDGWHCDLAYAAGDALITYSDASLGYSAPLDSPMTWRVAASAYVDTTWGTIPIAVTVSGTSPTAPK